MTEQFYSSIVELSRPGTAYAEYDPTDRTTWMMRQLEPRVGECILNLGCGSGKNAVVLAEAVGTPGYVLTVDRSYETLSALSQYSVDRGLENRIRFLHMHLDDLHGHLREEEFDRALGARELFSIRQPATVFQAIRQALKTGGIFFFYGPSRKDHAEFRLFYAALRGDALPQESKELGFMEKIGLPYARDVFAQVEVSTFENPLCFASPEALYAYWSESSLYNEALDSDFRQAALRHFQSHETFETAQRLIGIKATK
jgi:SAM-dependent methyltransferase